LLTAWTAWRFNPHATRCLDLGSGIGSVGLLTLHKMAETAVLTCVEIQQISYSLACRTVKFNGLQDRVKLVHGDLRNAELLACEDSWDQVTASPPYFPVGSALASPHPQRAGARMELKGDVFDYCKAAARVLAEDGVFTLCHAAADSRPEEAIWSSGLKLLSRREVFFRAGQKPTIALFVCARTGERQDEEHFTIRDANGRWTEEYLAMRREMGVSDLSVSLSEAPVGG
jgi:tRNA1(Val) A37 N6-methylase TrmN6